MIKLLGSLMPRRGRTVFALIFWSLSYLPASFLFQKTHPEYLLLVAAVQGIWLGIWCQDLHQFASSHVVPRFSTRMIGTYLMVLAATALAFALIALANHDLMAIIGLLLATIVATSALVLLVQKRWITYALPFGIWMLLTAIPDVTREDLTELLNSNYLNPMAGLTLVLGIAHMYFLLAKPTSIDRPNLRQELGNANVPKYRDAAGPYGVNWATHFKSALAGIALTLAFLHFYDRASTFAHLGWMIVIISNPTQHLGRAMCNAPRTWLAGVVSSRAELSMEILVRLLSTAGIYTVAALVTSLIANLLSIELPNNFVLIILLAFAGSALGLGLISSYSSNLEGKELTFSRGLLLGAIYFHIYVFNDIGFEITWLPFGILFCVALYFLYRGYQRVTNMEFTTF